MANESDRYDRQSSVISQEQLDKNIFIIGAGATSTWCSIMLAMIGTKKLIIADDDRVSRTNLNRQFFTEDDIGKYKAQQLAILLHKINSDITIMNSNIKITDSSQIPKDIDVIFCCVDNLKARKVVQDYIKKVNQKCVVFDPATMEDNPKSGSVTFIDKNNPYSKHIPKFNEMLQKEEKTAGCSLNPSPAIVTTSAMVAIIAVDNFMKWCNKQHYEGMFQVMLGKRPTIEYFKDS